VREATPKSLLNFALIVAWWQVSMSPRGRVSKLIGE